LTSNNKPFHSPTNNCKEFPNQVKHHFSII
jgi:hypothetical protein